VSFYRQEKDGIVVAIRLTPRGGRDAIDGPGVLAGGRFVLLARVRAAPESGRANDALIALIAGTFRRPKSAVSIASGATGRIKQVRIGGDTTALMAMAERLAQRSS
jgi:uncharacterized protein (TIGR00251 family)